MAYLATFYRAYPEFQATSAYLVGDLLLTAARGPLRFRVTTAGTSGSSVPVWPTVADQSVSSGSAVFAAELETALTQEASYGTVEPGQEYPGTLDLELRNIGDGVYVRVRLYFNPVALSPLSSWLSATLTHIRAGVTLSSQTLGQSMVSFADFRPGDFIKAATDALVPLSAPLSDNPFNALLRASLKKAS